MALYTPDMKTIASGYTIRVKIKRYHSWLWRLKIGMCLIRLAAWFMWVNIEIEGLD